MSHQGVGLSGSAYREVSKLIKESLDEHQKLFKVVIDSLKAENKLKSVAQQQCNQRIETRLESIEGMLAGKQVKYKFKHDYKTAAWVCIGAFIGSYGQFVIAHPKMVEILSVLLKIFV